MSHYLEIWLRDSAKIQLRKLSNQDPEIYHPKITIIRPFEVIGSEDAVRDKIADFCEGIAPIPFSLEGIGDFEKEFYHVPVSQNGELMRLNNGIEGLIGEDVKFVKRRDKVKNFHATVNMDKGGFYCPRLGQHMLRLTGIHDKTIWFEQDFVTGETLGREEALDKERWYGTLAKFKEGEGN